MIQNDPLQLSPSPFCWQQQCSAPESQGPVTSPGNSLGNPESWSNSPAL